MLQSQCNFQSIRKNSMQSLQKVGPSSTLCSHCKPKKVARQVAKRACCMLKLVSQCHCNISCEETHCVTLAVKLGSRVQCVTSLLQLATYFCVTLAVKLGSRVQCVTSLLQLATYFFSKVARQVTRKITLCNTTLRSFDHTSSSNR